MAVTVRVIAYPHLYVHHGKVSVLWMESAQPDLSSELQAVDFLKTFNTFMKRKPHHDRLKLKRVNLVFSPLIEKEVVGKSWDEQRRRQERKEWAPEPETI